MIRIPEANWYCGDFKDVMGQASIQGWYDPEIVNCDFPMGPKFGIQYLKMVMKFLDHNVADRLMLVANFVMRSPYRKQEETSGGEVIDRLMKVYAFPDHWSILPYYYAYLGGASKTARSLMGSFVLFKSGHDSIQYSDRRIDLQLEARI